MSFGQKRNRKKEKWKMAKALSFRIVIATIPVLLCLVLCGCVRHPPGSTPRPQASYLHWLEKESLLGRTSGLVSQVSQSGRLWLRSGTGNREDILLKAAPNWLMLKSGDSGRNYFNLARETLASLADSGIRGLYLGSLEGVQDIWLTGGEAQQGGGRRKGKYPDRFNPYWRGHAKGTGLYFASQAGGGASGALRDASGATGIMERASARQGRVAGYTPE